MLRLLYLRDRRLKYPLHRKIRSVGIETFQAVGLLKKIAINDSAENRTLAAASIELLYTQLVCLLRYFGSNDNLLLCYRHLMNRG
jgi:hypothetical protein